MAKALGLVDQPSLEKRVRLRRRTRLDWLAWLVRWGLLVTAVVLMLEQIYLGSGR